MRKEMIEEIGDMVIQDIIDEENKRKKLIEKIEKGQPIKSEAVPKMRKFIIKELAQIGIDSSHPKYDYILEMVFAASDILSRKRLKGLIAELGQQIN
jgi:hypothetical protein